MKRLNDSSDVPEARLRTLPKIFTSSLKKKAALCSPTKKWVLPSASAREPEERKFAVDSGASMHIGRKKDLHSAELETMRKSRSPTTVMKANGEVQTREEATVYIKQLDLFVKVMPLQETPAVLSLGKLCEDHGYFTTGRYAENPVPERSGSTSGELRGDPLHETTKNQKQK